MADVVNRVTKEYLRSVNDPLYSSVDWIINPDLSAVTGFASKYWTISGDDVLLMSQAERDAVDAAEASAIKDAIALAVEEAQTTMRAFAEVVLDEMNSHTTTVNAILSAIDAGSNLTTVKSGIAAIADLPTRTLANLRTAMRNKL